MEITKVCMAVVLLVTGLMGGCDKSTGSEQTPSASKSSNDSKNPIVLLKVYSADLGGHRTLEVYEFENVGNKNIDAFKGKFITYNKFNEPNNEIEIEYTQPISAKSKLYFERFFIGNQVRESGSADAESLESAAKNLNVTVNDLVVNQKYKFKLNKVVFAD